MTGRLIQTYRIEELLGEGGMGTVFRATDTVLERPVALKMLRAELLTQPQFLDRFRAEAQILARLNHPNVATLYNFVREEGDYYMVMEFVEGQTLEAWLGQYGPLPVELAVQVVQQALEGLAHAHKRGILHRDLKPANLMVTPEGVVKLTDFGIARIIGSQRLTQVNGLVGTPAYMAPEQIQGLEPSPQSDIHAMGLVLYELLSGQVPFATTNQFETMERVMRMVPPPLRPQLAGLPMALDDILEKALQKDPAARFADARTFQKTLFSVAPYTSSLDDLAVSVYQRPVSPPLAMTDLGNTLIDKLPMGEAAVSLPALPVSPARPVESPARPRTVPDHQEAEPTPPPTAKPAGPIPELKAAAPPARPDEVTVRPARPEAPRPARSRWKRVALWVVGILLGFVVLSNILYGPGRDKTATQTADSTATAVPLADKSPDVSPERNKTREGIPAVAKPNKLRPKAADAPAKAALYAKEPAKEASTSLKPVDASRVNSIAARPAVPTDDDPVSRPKPLPTPASNPATPSLPTAVAEKPIPRPEPAENRVVENRTAKPEPVESKGGAAPRSLKLSGGTEVVVALTEPLAAATAKSGQSISLQVVKPVVVKGEIVIPQGAIVQGEVTGVSTGGKKDMLEIRIQQIRVGGQRVSIKGGTFRYVGDRNEPLLFRSGQQFVVYTAGSHQFSL